MEFPVSQLEFDNWESLGSSVFLKNRAVLVPELSLHTGAFLSKNIVNDDSDNKWNMDIQLDIGNDDETNSGGNGVGIYYLE